MVLREGRVTAFFDAAEEPPGEHYDRGHPGVGPVIAFLRRFQSAAGLLGILILAIVFSPASAAGIRIFLEAGNLTDILRQMSLIGMIALAMTYVILTSGIDLSVGSILALSTSVVAMFLTKEYPSLNHVEHIAFAIAIALAISTAAGFLNGLVIATLDLQPFVVTLAGMIGIRGLAKWLTNNANIDIGFGQDVAASFAEAFRQKPVVIGAYAVLCGHFRLVLRVRFSDGTYGQSVITKAPLDIRGCRFGRSKCGSTRFPDYSPALRSQRDLLRALAWKPNSGAWQKLPAMVPRIAPASMDGTPSSASHWASTESQGALRSGMGPRPLNILCARRSGFIRYLRPIRLAQIERQRLNVGFSIPLNEEGAAPAAAEAGEPVSIEPPPHRVRARTRFVCVEVRTREGR